MHVDLYQSSNVATAEKHEQLHVQITFDHRGRQQDLRLSMGFTHGDNKTPWSYKNAKL